MHINLVKSCAIGLISGYLEAHSSESIFGHICKASQGRLSDYYCLRPAKIFDHEFLGYVFNPMRKLKDAATAAMTKYFPEFSMKDSSSCNSLISAARYLKSLGSTVDRDLYTRLIDFLNGPYKDCCMDIDWNASHIFVSSFLEEVIL